jgi:MFS family permease
MATTAANVETVRLTERHPAVVGLRREAPASVRARGKAAPRAFWIVSATLLFVAALTTAPNPLYGIYKQRDGFSSFTITAIFAATAAGIITSLFLLAHLSDSRGRRPLMLGAAAVAALAAVVLSLWTTLPALLAGRVLSGVALGIAVPTATAYLVELAEGAPSDRGETVALVANMGGLGVGGCTQASSRATCRTPRSLPTCWRLPQSPAV